MNNQTNSDGANPSFRIISQEVGTESYNEIKDRGLQMFANFLQDRLVIVESPHEDGEQTAAMLCIHTDLGHIMPVGRLYLEKDAELLDGFHLPQADPKAQALEALIEGLE